MNRSRDSIHSHNGSPARVASATPETRADGANPATPAHVPAPAASGHVPGEAGVIALLGIAMLSIAIFQFSRAE